MKIPTLLLVVLLGAAAPIAHAQTAYRAPVGYAFQSADEYADYEPEVLAAVNWLEKTPLGAEPALRRDATRFVFQWISGAPNVSVQLPKYVADLTAQDPDLLLLFMGGWARYQLQHPEVKDPAVLNTEGIRTMLRAYRAGGFRRNKQLETLAKLEANGTLAAWVSKQLAG